MVHSVSLFRHILCLTCSVVFLMPAAVRAQLPAKTDIDRYVQKEDSSYRWKKVSTRKIEGATLVVVEMVSQNWLTTKEVDRTEWRHWLNLVVPDACSSDTAMLYISGGSNGGSPPDAPSEQMQRIAMATKTVVAELKMVPNQALVFHDDGRARKEDDLIAYTWDQFIRTGESRWLARNAMVKSAVRAMDTVTAVSEELGGIRKVQKFVVAGASKRGWTTWLTGAMDERVVAIVPIVIDVLNTDLSMRHHFAAYGYWAPAVGNYVEQRIMQRMDDPKLQKAFELVDPYFYRHRLEKPKLVLNAAGDQFFLPDSSQFYWNDLVGEKHLRYVPNTDHGMDESDALETLVAYYWSIVAGVERPQMTWEYRSPNEIRVESDMPPVQAKLWQATNSTARDFRLETLGKRYTSELLTANSDGVYEAKVPKPMQGWTAYFVEFAYDIGGPVPLKLTTGVKVIPDVLPYSERSPTEPNTITLRCEFGGDGEATKAEATMSDLVRRSSSLELSTKTASEVLYLNWMPEDAGAELGQMQKWLKELGCRKVNVQLESGSHITTAATPE